MREQRNRYKGSPIRPWLRLDFLTRDGLTRTLDLLADTGCPQGVVLRPDLFDELVLTFTHAVRTNFGETQGGWVRLYTRDLGLVEFVEAFRGEQTARIASRSHPDFGGLVGLPILRMGEYGGDADTFWLRTPPT